MKCLTLWQPWAALWAGGKKVNETRPQPQGYRGLVAVHAGKAVNDEVRAALRHGVFRAALKELGYARPNDLPLGAVVGVVRLVACTPTDRLNPPYPESVFGNFAPGRHALVAAEPLLIEEPVPLRGRQGLFDLPPDLSARLQALHEERYPPRMAAVREHERRMKELF